MKNLDWRKVLLMTNGYIHTLISKLMTKINEKNKELHDHIMVHSSD